VWFDKREHPTLKLRTHLAVSDHPDHPGDEYLRAHFLWCLVINLIDGDVKFDYQQEEVPNFLNEMGDHIEDIDKTDDRWKTPLGVRVHEWLNATARHQY
jgi:hypothetical protein